MRMTVERRPPRPILRYSFLYALANERVIDTGELLFIESLVLRNGIVDDEEKAKLTGILDRVIPEQTRPGDWDAILDFKRRLGIR